MRGVETRTWLMAHTEVQPVDGDDRPRTVRALVREHVHGSNPHTTRVLLSTAAYWLGRLCVISQESPPQPVLAPLHRN